MRTTGSDGFELQVPLFGRGCQIARLGQQLHAPAHASALVVAKIAEARPQLLRTLIGDKSSAALPSFQQPILLEALQALPHRPGTYPEFARQNELAGKHRPGRPHAAPHRSHDQVADLLEEGLG